MADVSILNVNANGSAIESISASYNQDTETITF